MGTYACRWFGVDWCYKTRVVEKFEKWKKANEKRGNIINLRKTNHTVTGREGDCKMDNVRWPCAYCGIGVG